MLLVGQLQVTSRELSSNLQQLYNADEAVIESLTSLQLITSTFGDIRTTVALKTPKKVIGVLLADRNVIDKGK